MQLLDGISKTHIPSVLDVIDSLKESNGYSDKLLNVSSEAELRTLCEELNSAERTLHKITRSWYSIMPDIPADMLTEKLSTLTQEELIEIAELRRQRIELLSLPHMNRTDYYHKLYAISKRLYILTDYPPYMPTYYAYYSTSSDK